MLALAIAMGCNFVPLTVTAVSKVKNTDAGLASALLNVGQQVGGAIGLSVMATVFASTAKDWANHHITNLVQAARSALGPDAGAVLGAIQHAGKNGLEPDQVRALSAGKPAVYDFLHNGYYHRFAQEIQAHGSAHGFLTGSFFAMAALAAAATLIAVKKTDLAPGELAVAAH
jgi:hypothetical protein